MTIKEALEILQNSKNEHPAKIKQAMDIVKNKSIQIPQN
jgi:hypothetical protein